MKYIIICILFLSFWNLSIGQENKIKVDFAIPEYYPLVKTKASIYLERLPQYENAQKKTIFEGDSLSITDLMSPMKELKIGYFRALVSQAESGREVYVENGKIKFAQLPETIEFIEQCHTNNILPVLTLFEIPEPFRKMENGKLVRANVPPINFSGYGKTMGNYTKLFNRSIPLIWEVWNEPELSFFLDSDQPAQDYNSIYKNLAPEIKKANPDFLVAGPVAAGVEGRVEEFCNTFISNIKTYSLPLDLFTIHAYGRFAQSYVDESRKSTDHTNYIVDIARNSLGDDFQTTPIVFTEYEYYPAGVKYDLLHYNREYTWGAVKFLSDLKYFISQTDVQAVTWNRYVHRGETYRKGGLIDHYLNRRPIFYAFKFYGKMPEERKKFIISSANDSIEGFAAADEKMASIMLWNNSVKEEKIDISVENLPEAVVKSGYMAIYRMDKNHASYLEKSIEKCFPSVVEKVIHQSKSISIAVPGPGIIFIQFETDVARKGQKKILPYAKFIRNWQWCSREKADGITRITGDYGNFDWQNWTANIGVKGEKGRGIAGVTIDDTPQAMQCSFETFNVKESTQDINGIVALRIDYCVNGQYTEAVLIHGKLFNDKRDSELPWGFKGSKGNIVINCDKIGIGEKFRIDFEKYAPEAWKNSSERRTTISFWLENSGIESQASIRLFGIEN